MTMTATNRSRVPHGLLVTTRVLMSVVGIIYFWSYWRQLDFIWYGRSQLEGTALCLGLMLILFVRAFGFGGWYLDRALSIAHCCGAQQLLMCSFPYATINECLYMMLAFWCCFIQLNPPKDSIIPAWAPILLAINFAITFHTSGLDKAQDDIWRDGIGFYHFLRLNTLRAHSADWMLSHRTALYLMNYVALAAEIGTLPLLLYRWTRPIGMALLVGFFASLIYPFRMDMIGETGICLALLSSVGTASALMHRPQRLPAIGWLMIVYLAVVGGSDLTTVWGDKSSGPFSRACWTVHGWLQDCIPETAQWVNNNATMLAPNRLFTSHHTLGQYAWRVLVTMPDGSITEPVRVFLPDRSGGPDTQGFGCTRHYQACAYSISYSFAGGHDPSYVVNALLECCINRSGGVSAVLVTSQLEEPYSNWKPWEKQYKLKRETVSKAEPGTSVMVFPICLALSVGVLALGKKMLTGAW